MALRVLAGTGLDAAQQMDVVTGLAIYVQGRIRSAASWPPTDC